MRAWIASFSLALSLVLATLGLAAMAQAATTAAGLAEIGRAHV